MGIFGRVKAFIEDPPPSHVFEISSGGIAWSIEGRQGFERLNDGILSINPLRDNVLEPDALAGVIRRLAPPAPNAKRRRPCAVILPDFAARLVVLDFDNLPSKVEEQTPLIRFRLKRTLPFDLDTAAIQFVARETAGRHEVLVAAVSFEILSRYEAAFRAADMQPGFVTLSLLAMMDLAETKSSAETAMIARLDGSNFTVAALSGDAVRLVRCIKVERTVEELADVIQPTAAFMEDEFGEPLQRVVACGLEEFPGIWPEAASVTNLNIPPASAGLTGYLRAISH